MRVVEALLAGAAAALACIQTQMCTQVDQAPTQAAITPDMVVTVHTTAVVL